MRTSKVHYIAPSAISITPNANGSSRDLAVYVARGAKIKVYYPRIYTLSTINAIFQEWTLSGRNRRLSDTTGTVPYTIYARLRKVTDWSSDEDIAAAHADAYLVFAAQVHDDISDTWSDPYVLSPNDSATLSKSAIGANGKDYSWGPISVRQTEDNRSGYWWVKLGTVSAADENGQRTVDIDTGILGTDQYNEEWYLNPDDLPLRVDLSCTVNDEDAGPTPYLYWGQTAVLAAHLVEGWETDASEKIDHWTITRRIGNDEVLVASSDSSGSDSSDEEDAWPGFERAGNFAEHGIIPISHVRGDGDDFLSAVAAVFTVTAWGSRSGFVAVDSSSSGESSDSGSDSSSDSSSPESGEATPAEIVPLAKASITIFAEAVGRYELVLSTNIVSYSPAYGTYSPSDGVDVRIRVTEQDGKSSYLEQDEIVTSGLKTYFKYGTAEWAELTFTDGQANIGTQVFTNHQNVSVRLVDAAGSEIALQTVAFVRDGEDSRVREWIYKRGKTGTIPATPTVSNYQFGDTFYEILDSTGDTPTTDYGDMVVVRTSPILYKWVQGENGEEDRLEEIGTAANGYYYQLGDDEYYIWDGRLWVDAGMTAPSGPANAVDDMVPAGWTDNPQGVSEEWPYEFASYRDYDAANNVWGPFCTPFIWSHWGDRGVDGDGVEYVFIRTTKKVAPVIADDGANFDSMLYEPGDEDYLPVARVSSGSIEENHVYERIIAERDDWTGWGECTDNPKGATREWPYEWCAMRKSILAADGKRRTWPDYERKAMALWATWSERNVRLDLDNQADILAVDSDGHLRFDRDITVRARVYDGAAMATGVSIPNSMTAEQLANTIPVGGCVPTVSLAGDVLTVTWPFRRQASSVSSDSSSSSSDSDNGTASVYTGAYAVSIGLTYKGETYSATFTLTTMNTEAVYQIRTTKDKVGFSFNANNVLTPSNVQVKVGWIKADASGTTIHDMTELSAPTSKIPGAGLYVIARPVKADGGYIPTYGNAQQAGWDWAGHTNKFLNPADNAEPGITRTLNGEFTIPSGTNFSALEVALSFKVPASTTDSDILDREVIPILKGGRNGSGGLSITGTADYYAVNNDKDHYPLRWANDDGGTKTFDSVQAFTEALAGRYVTTGIATSEASPWLWNFEAHTMSDGTVHVTPVHRIGSFAKSIRSIKEFYALSQYEDETQALASIYNPREWLVDYYDGIEYDEPQRMWASKTNPSWWYGKSMLAVTEDNYLDQWDEPKYGYMGGDMSDGFNSLTGQGDYQDVPTYYRADGNTNRAPNRAYPYQWNWEHIEYTDGTKEEFFHISSRIGEAGPAGPAGDTPINCYRWYKEGETVNKPIDTTKVEPSAYADDCYNNSSKARPVTVWDDTAPDRPGDGWELWMCQSVKHTSAAAVVTIDAWSEPVRISGARGTAGEDARDREWVYQRSATGSTPSTPSIPIGDFSFRGTFYEILSSASASPTTDYGDTVVVRNSSTLYEWVQGENGEDDHLETIGTAAVGDVWQMGDDEYYYWNGSLWVNAGETAPSGSFALLDDYVPSGWTDNPQGVTEALPYEFASYRSYDPGTRTWGTFSTPILWSHYGHNGMDGDGMEYVFVRTKEYVKPSFYGYANIFYRDSYYRAVGNDEHLPLVSISSGSAGDIKGNTHWKTNGYDGLVAECTDDPVGVDSTYKFEWVLMRRKNTAVNGTRTWKPYSGDMSLWSNWNASPESYMEVQEAWSSHDALPLTDLEDGNGNMVDTNWSYSTPAKPIGKEYLWRRTRQMTLNTSTMKYDVGTWSYMRLNGTNGTSIDVKGTVVYVRTASGNWPTGVANGSLGIIDNDATLYAYDGTSWEHTGQARSNGDCYVVEGSCTYNGEQVNGYMFMYSTEAGNRWIKIGKFQGAPGTTYYTHIAWAKGITLATVENPAAEPKTGQLNIPNATAIETDNSNNPYFSISPQTGYYWMGVLVDTNSSTDSTQWQYYTWQYVKGADGTSPWMADLDNEMDSVITDSDGNVITQQSVQTTVRLWHGSAKQYFTLAVYDTTTSPETEYVQGETKNDIKAEWTTASNVDERTLTVTFLNGAQLPSGSKYKKIFRLVLTPTSGSGSYELFLTVNAARPGADGKPATVYNLVPSMSQISVGRTSTGDYSPSTVAITCGYTKRTGNGEPSSVADATGQIDTTGYYIFFRRRIRAGVTINSTKYVTATWEPDPNDSTNKDIYYRYGGRYDGVDNKTLLSTLNVNTYDAVEFVIHKNKTSNPDGSVTVAQGTALANVIDRETVPVVADGKEGAGSVKLDLDNENETMLYDESGNLLSGSAVSTGHLYDGATEVTNLVSANGWSLVNPVNVVTGISNSEALNYAKNEGNVITVNGISGSSGSVTLCAHYNDTNYYAKFTLKKQKGGSVYKLIVTPNAIAYNTTTSTASASSIAAKVMKLSTTNNKFEPSAPPSNYSLMFCVPSGNNYILATNGNKGNVSDGTFNNINAAGMTEVRVVIAKTKEITVSGNTITVVDEDTVLDSETVPINKSANGSQGPAVQVVVTPNPILFDVDSFGDGTINDYKTFSVSMKVNGTKATLKSITEISCTANGVVVEETLNGDTINSNGITGINAQEKTLYVRLKTGQNIEGSIGFTVTGTLAGSTTEYTATGIVSIGVSKQGNEGPNGKDAPTVFFDPGIIVFKGDTNGNVILDNNTAKYKSFKVSMSVNGNLCTLSKIEISDRPSTLNVNQVEGVSVTNTPINVNAQEVTLWANLISLNTSPSGSIKMKVTGTLTVNSETKTYSAWGSLPVTTTVQGTEGQSITGATGAMFNMRGKYTDGVEYNRTAELVDMVFFDDGEVHEDRGRGNWYYLSSTAIENRIELTNKYTVNGVTNYCAPAAADADGNAYSTISGIWIKAADFGVVITQGLFAEFAKNGSAIMSGDWMFSCNGSIGGQDYSSSNIRTTATIDRTLQVNENHANDVIENMTAYTLFDTKFPLGTEKYSIVHTTAYITNTTPAYISISDTFVLRKGVTYKFRIAASLSRNDQGTVQNGQGLFACVYYNGAYRYSLGNLQERSSGVIEATVTPNETITASVGMAVNNSILKGKITSITYEVVSSFNPYYAVDLLTGKSYQNDAYIRGEVHATSGEFNGTVKANGFYTPSTQVNVTSLNEYTDYVINPAENPSNLFYCNGVTGRAVRLFLPEPDDYDGMELSFYLILPRTRSESDRMYLLSNTSYIRGDDAGGLGYYDYKKIQLGNGVMFKLKSFAHYWWVIEGNGNFTGYDTL